MHVPGQPLRGLAEKLTAGTSYTVMYAVLVFTDESVPLYAVSVTVYVPALKYVVLGVVPELGGVPFPKFHWYRVAPVDELVNLTTRGAQPVVGVLVPKSATTWQLERTALRQRYKHNIMLRYLSMMV